MTAPQAALTRIPPETRPEAALVAVAHGEVA
jgi:hypothetical protein